MLRRVRPAKYRSPRTPLATSDCSATRWRHTFARSGWFAATRRRTAPSHFVEYRPASTAFRSRSGTRRVWSRHRRLLLDLCSYSRRTPRAGRQARERASPTASFRFLCFGFRLVLLVAVLVFWRRFGDG